MTAPKTMLEGERTQHLAATAGAVFAKAGYDPCEVGVIQPAEIVLDHANRDVRRSFYMLTDVEGRSFYLRPDFTLPICLDYIKTPQGRRRLSYAGPVFRFEDGAAGRAFQARQQVGIEYLGARKHAEADAEIMSLTLRALQSAGITRTRFTMGDPLFFDALVAALDLPQHLRVQLKRLFRRPPLLSVERGVLRQYSPVDALLTRARNRRQPARRQTRAALEADLRKKGIVHVGRRTLSEVAERLRAQESMARAVLPKRAASVLRRFLLIEAPPRRAVEKISALARETGARLDAPLQTMTRRLDAMDAQELNVAQGVFYTRFLGVSLSYYTDFVFAYATPGHKRPLASGGRYDGLLRALRARDTTPGTRARAPASGVGASVYLDSVSSALERTEDA